MTRPAQLLFALLFISTLSAFVLSQRLKERPAFVRGVRVTPHFSPNGDGFRDRATVRFVLARPDAVTVSVLDERERVVRRLAAGRRLPAGRRVRFEWDGRTDAGPLAPAGRYRVRVWLGDQRRSIDLVQALRLRVGPRRPARGRRASDGERSTGVD